MNDWSMRVIETDSVRVSQIRLRMRCMRSPTHRTSMYVRTEYSHQRNDDSTDLKFRIQATVEL